MKRALQEVAEIVGGEVVGDGATVLTGVAGIKEAGPGDLTFLANPKYEKYLAATSASAVIVSRDYRERPELDGRAALLCENPYGAFAEAMALFAPEGEQVPEGIHPTAVVAEGTALGPRTAVGANVVIMDAVTVGEGTVIHPGCYIGRDVVLGSETVIHPNVTIRHGSIIGDRVVIHSGTVIGSDGFGFAREDCGHRKVPQIGNVVIEDDVEIGANAAVDRATIGSTRICTGAKLDNLVQVAHNVVIGEGAIIVAQVGISGSTRVGRGAVLGGQSGLVGHIEIGDGAMIGAQAGVTKSIPAGERVSGYPARRHATAKKVYALVENLPRLFQKVTNLARRVEALERARESLSRPGDDGEG